MDCPYCSNKDHKVLDSRSSKNSIRRRRECTKCNRRFTTYEYVETVPLTVIKRDGSREDFQRDKLQRGLLTACKKRHISRQQIDDLVLYIENELIGSGTKEVSYEIIGNLVMEQLKDMDSVAYVRFASVYREFKDCGEFVNQINEMK